MLTVGSLPPHTTVSAASTETYFTGQSVVQKLHVHDADLRIVTEVRSVAYEPGARSFVKSCS
jgi:hypothetical protein